MISQELSSVFETSEQMFEECVLYRHVSNLMLEAEHAPQYGDYAIQLFNTIYAILSLLELSGLPIRDSYWDWVYYFYNEHIVTNH